MSPGALLGVETRCAKKNGHTVDGNQKSGKLASWGLVVYPIIHRVSLYIWGGNFLAGFLKHQRWMFVVSPRRQTKMEDDQENEHPVRNLVPWPQGFFKLRRKNGGVLGFWKYQGSWPAVLPVALNALTGNADLPVSILFKICQLQTCKLGESDCCGCRRACQTEDWNKDFLWYYGHTLHITTLLKQWKAYNDDEKCRAPIRCLSSGLVIRVSLQVWDEPEIRSVGIDAGGDWWLTPNMEKAGRFVYIQGYIYKVLPYIYICTDMYCIV